MVARAHRDRVRAVGGAGALSRPGYEPPRSWLLVLVGAGLGVSLVSACRGLSVQRSLWSDFERMQGVVDQAHWCALAVVLRTPREWSRLGVAKEEATLAVVGPAKGAHLTLATPCEQKQPNRGDLHRPLALMRRESCREAADFLVGEIRTCAAL